MRYPSTQANLHVSSFIYMKERNTYILLQCITGQFFEWNKIYGSETGLLSKATLQNLEEVDISDWVSRYHKFVVATSPRYKPHGNCNAASRTTYPTANKIQNTATNTVHRSRWVLHASDKANKIIFTLCNSNPCTKKRSIKASLHVKINKKIKSALNIQDENRTYEISTKTLIAMNHTCKKLARQKREQLRQQLAITCAVTCASLGTQMAAASSRHSLLPTNNIKLLHHRWYRSWEKLWRYLFSFVFGSHFNHQTSLCPLREK